LRRREGKEEGGEGEKAEEEEAEAKLESGGRGKEPAIDFGFLLSAPEYARYIGWYFCTHCHHAYHCTMC
jgi:hypothetical protein